MLTFPLPRRSISRRRPPGAAAALFGAVLAAAVLGAAAGGVKAGEAAAAASFPGSAEPAYTVEDCVALALKQNTDVLTSAKKLEAARAVVTQAKAGIYPSLTSSAVYQRLQQTLTNRSNLALAIKPDDYTVDARLTQNVFSSGAVRARIAAAKLAERSAALDYQAQLETTILLVRAAFYQTLYAAGNIRVREQALDLLGSQLKDQRDRLAAGSVSQVNVNRAQVALANEEPLLNEARLALSSAYITLAQALAVPYPAGAAAPPFRVRGELVARSTKYSLDECLRRAEDQRPEIAGRQLDLEALGRQLTVDKSATRPRVDAFAAYDLYSETSTLATNNYFKGYTIGVSANWQIFDGFATLGRVRATRARIGGAAAALTSIRQQVQADVRTAYYQLQEAQATLRPQAENIRLAKETLQVTENNFNAGLASQLDVLQSRVDLTRAESTEIAGRLACNVAVARLERAMGEGRPAPVAAPAAGARGARAAGRPGGPAK